MVGPIRRRGEDTLFVAVAGEPFADCVAVPRRCWRGPRRCRRRWSWPYRRFTVVHDIRPPMQKYVASTGVLPRPSDGQADAQAHLPTTPHA